MARSHHRKKHKAQLQHFKHDHDTPAEKVKARESRVFAVTGAVVGLAIGYIGSEGQIIWTLAGLIIGGLLGFIAGRSLEKK